ncbi:MAG: hypothetical protein BIFFINMI_03752 [Phycisphaerae bacterium]|nr:hypothetical protein [Phycisphaerae bacterium]
MLKRLLDSRVHARTRHAIDREIQLKVITLNLMILALLLHALLNRASLSRFFPCPGRNERTPLRGVRGGIQPGAIVYMPPGGGPVRGIAGGGCTPVGAVLPAGVFVSGGGKTTW